jgi:hypothetical protein
MQKEGKSGLIEQCEQRTEGLKSHTETVRGSLPACLGSLVFRNIIYIYLEAYIHTCVCVCVCVCVCSIYLGAKT